MNDREKRADESIQRLLSDDTQRHIRVTANRFVAYVPLAVNKPSTRRLVQIWRVLIEHTFGLPLKILWDTKLVFAALIDGHYQGVRHFALWLLTASVFSVLIGIVTPFLSFMKAMQYAISGKSIEFIPKKEWLEQRPGSFQRNDE